MKENGKMFFWMIYLDYEGSGYIEENNYIKCFYECCYFFIFCELLKFK